ncbi:MAG: hypothetical protein PWQ92_1552 [Thermococcaceae archaeon]|nr:hypothetical protein [Thermococcaceae archaeon]
MINLKKLFRRKKGQGALEYLFMVAAALIIIFVVVRYISGTVQQASSQTAIASLQSQAELVKTNLQAKDFWNDNYYVVDNNDQNLTIETVDGTIIAVDTNLEYYGDEVPNNYLNTNETLKNLYEACTKDNDENACMILIDLQDAKSP